ncbi:MULTISPECIES: cupin domain-containing protein [Hymenobacter]|uniref:cupin domain-containing protein n=1 Tax=Hymenobacter TaxID=89966 RepID=UPI001F10ED64|nr:MULTISPECIES: cupin domain-containing protein [Hymenobacter]
MSTETTASKATANAAFDSPAQVMDLEHAIVQAKQTQSWTSSDRHAVTLFKSESLRLVLLGLHKGAELKTHTAPGIITVQVLEGQITFRTAQQSFILTAGQLLMLPAGVPHSVYAHQDSFFLLTVAVTAA